MNRNEESSLPGITSMPSISRHGSEARARGWTGGSPRCRPGAGAAAGFRLAAPAEVLTGAALIGQAVLYRWPAEGWVRCTVARRSRAAGFTHVVSYGRTSPLGSAETPSLLLQRVR